MVGHHPLHRGGMNDGSFFHVIDGASWMDGGVGTGKVGGQERRWGAGMMDHGWIAPIGPATPLFLPPVWHLRGTWGIWGGLEWVDQRERERDDRSKQAVYRHGKAVELETRACLRVDRRAIANRKSHRTQPLL